MAKKKIDKMDLLDEVIAKTPELSTALNSCIRLRYHAFNDVGEVYHILSKLALKYVRADDETNFKDKCYKVEEALANYFTQAEKLIYEVAETTRVQGHLPTWKDTEAYRHVKDRPEFKAWEEKSAVEKAKEVADMDKAVALIDKLRDIASENANGIIYPEEVAKKLDLPLRDAYILLFHNVSASNLKSSDGGFILKQ